MATAILLETDRLDSSLSGRVASPCLLSIAGRTLASYAVEALSSSGNIDDLVLVGPNSLRDVAGVDDQLLSNGSSDDLCSLVSAKYGQRDELLFWQPNAPLLDDDSLDRFFAHAPLDAGVTLAWTKASDAPSWADAPLPSPLTFGEQKLFYTGLALVKPGCLIGKPDLMAALASPNGLRNQLAKILGLRLAVKVNTGYASLDVVAERLGELLGVRTVFVTLSAPGLALRVRTRTEYNWARERMEVG